MKIGRNAPCPCGSGKKYKKCCMDKPKTQPVQLLAERRWHWSLEEIDAFSTDEIVSKLRYFGVPFETAQFLEDVQRFHSGEELADHWKQVHAITARGFDRDFIWMAAIVLWERLAPGVMSSERLDRLMQQGYRLLEDNEGDRRGNRFEACRIWLEVWEHLKTRFQPEMRSGKAAERGFRGLQSLFNWCQDLERELYNAGLEDPVFFEKAIAYCREFCSYFPDSDELLLHNMKRTEAEAHFALGREGEGDRLFQALIDQFPNNAWGYIGWGDMYAWPIKAGGARDLERAKQILEMGLSANVTNKTDILGRLRDLDEER
ncbi:MAG: SEC-C domain-containing protein [Syntrophobacteraceae bacterium]|jgi:hypothetical protein|nr:SEC-C domain-containing protein [Syntrophobacteraceae bacterium]